MWKAKHASHIRTASTAAEYFQTPNQNRRLHKILDTTWENGYCESFNSKLRDEFLNLELFYSMKELRVLAECWRRHYNTIRPHSSLGYRPPAPEARLTNNKGHGEVETATRFPLLHTLDGGYLNSEVTALH
jgi:putative transposase